jgi:hypothetical protein
MRAWVALRLLSRIRFAEDFGLLQTEILPMLWFGDPEPVANEK